jgi:hypothetical protein
MENHRLEIIYSRLFASQAPRGSPCIISVAAAAHKGEADSPAGV